MANKRMFSMDVVDTDKFLEMPTSTQALYFHLGMRADDDGFVSSPKKIMSMAGCNSDDIKLLITKGYIIPFENGVIVIKHWRMNNTLKSDRYNPTTYQEQLALLDLKINKVYTEKDDQPLGNHLETTWNQTGTKLEPQYSIDKNRIDKDSIDKDITSQSDEVAAAHINYQSIIDMYNDICISYPKVTKLSEARKKAIKARLRLYNLDDFKKLFTMAEESDFLKGANNRNWSATFDWLISDANMAKVLSGNYKNTGNHNNSFNNFEQRSYDYEELEKQLLSK